MRVKWINPTYNEKLSARMIFCYIYIYSIEAYNMHNSSKEFKRQLQNIFNDWSIFDNDY